MKKLTLSLLCVIAVIIASCKKNEQIPSPLCKFVEEEGYIFQDTTVGQGDTIRLKVECAISHKSDPLSRFSLIITPKTSPSESVNKIEVDLKSQSSYAAVYEIVAKNIGTYNIKMTIRTESGRSKTKSINVTSERVVYGEADFEWMRQGTNPAVGLEMFGLKWVSNYKDKKASIKPMDTIAKRLVDFRILNNTDFEKITNKDEVIAEFEKGMKIAEFHEISCEQASATYNYVIATHVLRNYGTDTDTYFIMNVRKSTLEGSTVTITGRYKWVDAK